MRAGNIYKIVVPISLKGDSEQALKQALFLCKKTKSTLTLLHVVPSDKSILRVMRSNINKRLQARGMVRLIRFAKLFFEGKIPNNIHLKVEIGNHVESIIDFANSERFDLLVLNSGKRIHNLSSRLKRQSVERIVRETICPVISVNDRWTNTGVRDILVPIDITRKSKDLIEWCIFMGQTFNARIELLAALTVKIELKRSLAYRKTQIMKNWIERDGVSCKVEIVEREMSSRIDTTLEELKHRKADLILIKGHRDLIFSDTEGERMMSEIIKSSQVPVMSLGIEFEEFFTDIIGANSQKKSDRIPFYMYEKKEYNNNH